MTLDTSPELMARLRNSIQPISTDLSLRQVLSEDFPRECSDLPIAGGWGYTPQIAIVFVRQKFPIPAVADFVPYEYLIIQKIIYEELIVFRSRDDRFSGIDFALNSQSLKRMEGRSYDCIDVGISCWSDIHWDALKKDWEDNHFGQRAGFDKEAHVAQREAARITYDRRFWFDISDVMAA